MSHHVSKINVPSETSTADRVSGGMISQEFKAFNRLVWQPVSSMHPSWWQALALKGWQDKYQANTELARRIETLVVRRYGLAERVLPTHLDVQQQAVLGMRFKIEAIVTVLGLFYLNTPEYLSLRIYRDALAYVLTSAQIQQAWAIWPQRPTREMRLQLSVIPPDKLLERAQAVGVTLIASQWQEDPLWLALALMLPSARLELSDLQAYQPTGEVNIPRWLSRLERLL
ncbi:Type III secretion system subunit [Shewanella psychrophila]|uniref:Type III secretion system subunit n=1 Tax=Shewanella psychrophila TaxID=225848 RepID=A0A1S6HKX1_9GAMM|nr:type III secretion system domain-containing protein [Shewanella psychrophila]AQS36181.1 Type III secretion system subunit [Shewanella psychrophila]